MRSFDGAVASYGNEHWQASVRYGVPTKGVFDLKAVEEIRNTDLIYASLFQILPTPRLYAMTPFYNMMNINDAMAQSVLNQPANLEMQSPLHGLWLDAKNTWYSGGVFDNWIFGYAGRTSNGYLGSLTDCQATWKMNSHFALQLYYGHIFGGTAGGGVYPVGREANYGYIQTTWL